jgi:TatA/E family protein of Tat protein translocase
MIGSTELIVIGLIVFILFGARSIPKFAKSIREARQEFQKGIDDIKSDEKISSNDTEKKTNREKSE